MLLCGIRRPVDRTVVKQMIIFIAWQMLFIVWAPLIKHSLIKVLNIRLHYGEHKYNACYDRYEHGKVMEMIVENGIELCLQYLDSMPLRYAPKAFKIITEVRQKN